ncbi:glycosyl hydrolase family 28 protein [Flammeovirgaceae bacterium SG7u.111]|nr:glycosyl hydrolase family 28 protein [Flammeovirgaceae bacterium SG7u.132]WPO37620.1 glycosyl hydrolase family 28 protein [Flammeovirgaceae bacterium SG7u.111]
MKRNYFIFCLFSLGLFATCNPPKKSWDVREFGAVADSVTMNTKAIQQAIDACHQAGGGIVELKEGEYISGTILLKDNVTLSVSKDAKLIGSPNPMDYQSIDPFTDATGQLRGKCLVGSLNATNVGIIGGGVIDGQGEMFKKGKLLSTMKKLGVDKSEINAYASNRPFLVRFVKSTDIVVEDIELRQPAAWTCHFFQCSKIKVNKVKIYSHAHKNNDGIDLDSSSDGIVTNCDIDAGDDAICFKSTSPVPTQNIQVSNCKLKSDWGTIKFGTESMGDFKNITVKNCKIYDTKGGGIKILSVDGANISDITIDSIQMENVDMPIFIRLGERLRTYRGAPQQAVGSITNVRISNVVATARSLDESRVTPPSGVFITGTPNHKIGKVSLKNIQVNLPGGGTAEQSELEVPEDEKRYPEFSFFGVSPASGLYARHVQYLSVDALSVSLVAKDDRQGFIYSDVDNKNLNDVQID